MKDVHARVSAWMAAAGMDARIDSAGNIRGLRSASTSRAPRLYIGSHLDTVPDAGPFDGILGVMIGIELVDVAARAGRAFPYDIEVIGFSDEEGVRFGLPFIGSRAFVGSLDDLSLQRRDAGGRTLSDAIRDFGLDPSALGDAHYQVPALGYLEFHIEQGPTLDTISMSLGVVNAIVGQTRADAVFVGQANHAGTTPMGSRRDALAAAAEWISIVERQAVVTKALLATVGRVRVEPNAGNVIPGRCELSVDIRHADDSHRRTAAQQLERAGREIAARRHVEFAWDVRLDQDSVPMDQLLTAQLLAAAAAGPGAHRMNSGAGHDAMIVAPHMPTAMLFLRCDKGISHHPAESVPVQAVDDALAAGLAFLDGLSRSSSV